MKIESLIKACDLILAANMAEYDSEKIAKKTAMRDFWRLINGNALEKQDVLDTYELDHLRVCEECGKLIDEGWLLDCTVACSDECAAKFFDETVEKFKYRMSDENFIKQAMEWDHCEKRYEDLTDEEREKYLEDAMNMTEYYWTEWN